MVFCCHVEKETANVRHLLEPLEKRRVELCIALENIWEVMMLRIYDPMLMSGQQCRSRRVALCHFIEAVVGKAGYRNIPKSLQN